MKKVKVACWWLILCNPMDYIVHGILQIRILKWVAFPFPGDLPNPGIERKFPTLQADSLPAESRGKPTNIGVSSLSLLQWFFLTQESNWGLLHYRQIPYQLSYEDCSVIMYSLEKEELNPQLFLWILLPQRHRGRLKMFQRYLGFMCLFFFNFIFIWQQQVLVAAHRIFNLCCRMQDL